MITVNSRYDPWSNWKLSRNFLVPLEMWTEEVFFSECKSFSLPGNSRCPWECDQKGLTSAYQKMVYLPKPDYSYRYHHTAVIKWWFVVILRYSLWKELILSAGGNLSHSDFDLSSLTKISDGWEHFQYLLQNRRLKRKASLPIWLGDNLIPQCIKGHLTSSHFFYRNDLNFRNETSDQMLTDGQVGRSANAWRRLWPRREFSNRSLNIWR